MLENPASDGIDVAANNAVYYYHFDGLGSVAALSDSVRRHVMKEKFVVQLTRFVYNPYRQFAGLCKRFVGHRLFGCK